VVWLSASQKLLDEVGVDRRRDPDGGDGRGHGLERESFLKLAEKVESRVPAMLQSEFVFELVVARLDEHRGDDRGDVLGVDAVAGLHHQHLLLEGRVGDVEVHVLEGARRIDDAGRLVGAGALRRGWLAARH